MLWRPLETSQVENRSPIRVKIATPCVLCPVRTCAAPPGEHHASMCVKFWERVSAHTLHTHHRARNAGYEAQRLLCWDHHRDATGMPALTSHTPPWNCPATSLTQRRVYSIGLAMGLCVRNCWGRKQGSPAAQRGAHNCAQRAAASWAAAQRCRAADASRLQQQDSLEAGAVDDERQTAWA